MGLKDKNHWEDHYSLELNNFKEDGDEGEIWFGRRLNDRIAGWLADRCRSSLVADTPPRRNIAIIDIGCGNSQLLITLMKRIQAQHGASSADFTLLGLDFSTSAVELSREILKAVSMEDKIIVEQCDFLQLDQLESVTLAGAANRKSFEFVLDKGTFDAICLLAEGQDSPDALTEAIRLYKQSLASLLQPDSVVVLASCNNTEEELIEIFQRRDETSRFLRPIGRIETPTMSFGGRTGSQVACVMFAYVSQDS